MNEANGGQPSPSQGIATRAAASMRRAIRTDAWLTQLAQRGVPYLVAVLVLGYVASHHWFWATALVAIVLGALGIMVHKKLAEIRSTNLGPGPRLGILLAIAEIGFILLAVGNWRVISPVGFVGVTLVGFGFGQLAAEVRDSPSLNGPIALLLIVNFVAALGLALGTGVGGWALLIGPAVIAFPTVSVVTEVLLDRLQHGRAWANGKQTKTVLVIVAAALVAGMLLLLSVGGLVFALLAAAIILVLVGLISSNTDFDVLFILVALAVIWSQFPRTEQGVPPSSGTGEILSIGDSYISGEGAQRYYEGTNEKTRGHVNQCRRSPKTYSVRIATAHNDALDFLACSGAKVDNLIGKQPPSPAPPHRGQYVAENPRAAQAASPTGQPARALTQLELFDLRSRNDKVTLVMVSIGGNDSGFGDLVQTCLAPGDCSERGQKWLDKLSTLGLRLDAIYGELRERFGSRVVVVPYPVPIRARGCGIFRSTLLDREHEFVHAFTEQLNLVIRMSASKNQLHYLSGATTAFESAQRQICDTRADLAAVNYLALNPVGGEIDPTGWFHNSMHPNARGHRILTDVVEKWLANGGTAQAIEQPADVPQAQLSLTELIGPSTSVCGHENRPSRSCKQSDQQWMFQQTRLALLNRLLALALLVGGAWLFWLDRLRDRHLDRFARRMVPSMQQDRKDTP